MSNVLLSLCLPTNGIIEWVFPVLDSIYAQNANESEFEVIVTNNGENEEFHRLMLEYEKKHDNLKYKKTSAYMFHNQLEALKLASGKYFKLINHRAAFEPGAVEKLIDIVRENIVNRPIMYFSNGVLKEETYEMNSFDMFVSILGEYASWTTGVGIWKDDYDRLPIDLKIDKISPHSCILFAYRDREKYKIYNYVFSKELDSDHSKKGTYDIFKAFGVEELTITQNLYIDGNISINTFKKVKNDYRRLVTQFYYMFCIRKDPCSYDLSGFNDAMGIYYNKYDIILQAYLLEMKGVFSKILGFGRMIGKVIGRKR